MEKVQLQTATDILLFSDFYVFSFDPLFRLPIQFVMLASIQIASLPSVTRHIQLNLNSHRLLLAIRQIPVADRIALQLGLIEMRYFCRIHRNQFILLVPVPNITRSPFIGSLLPEEAEPTITLGVDFAALDVKPLGDGGLHFGCRSCSCGVDVGC